MLGGKYDAVVEESDSSTRGLRGLEHPTEIDSPRGEAGEEKTTFRHFTKTCISGPRKASAKTSMTLDISGAAPC